MNIIDYLFNIINIFIDIILNIVYNHFNKGVNNMAFENTWIAELDSEDINFIKRFILASGSLKEVASIYDVSYPTVRLRLDRLIQKIEINDKSNDDQFINMIKRMTIDEKLELETAKAIINTYKKTKEAKND